MTLLTGWGRTAPTPATVRRPRSAEEVAEQLRAAGPRGVVARGLGRAYGDAAQNAGGLVLDCTGLAPTWSHDPATGLVTASAGLSLHELMLELVPRGWFVPVTPGTRYVTVGGAIAADVHGKNHHVDSSFGAHLRTLTLVTADGTRHVLGPGDDLFWATVGGMGLTGVIVEASFQCIPIETAWMVVDVERTRDLDETLEAMTARDRGHRYTVAWIDLLARGRAMGRSVITSGEHARLEDLPARLRRDPLAFHPRPRLAAPGWVPGGLLNRATIRAFNAVWYGKAPARRKRVVQGIASFFHPLDGVEGWNRLYGPRGFIQYQFVVPFGAEETLRRVVAALSAERVPSFLTVLKRLGPGTNGMLSFPMPGWTLALDIPAGLPGLAGLLRRFDTWVAEAGGRLYLAKDSRMPAEMLAATYPRLGEWLAIKRRVDPEGRFTSDLARRLGLCDGTAAERS
ncbi:oxidoreductase [Thermobispora bispora]|uniref:FAD linked oxidase domain protein n=1 Tax=Thermobispora bispora (strain ATCC 19993 / DSM 43833 / CBS 139.67 / JCM 10125 / KCTC 9307 / NBRC 14880 / R51) TaxID=469371 RepID=D6Y6G4_THEBD|nr:FAD-binding oxidoreductase [Thermobispora bispora]MBO2472875.1 FAD-binding oxidoreductase [Actinomycetales bacterium]MDI9580451.1 FAD-binding oxidoreductase [Thermobispora sp.]ADG87536.1 FAD linked oxidase domain protein [Thermobispora bispora DSM 43833]MBX6168292.1 FAD-binding oxidoreductase [Thermobispora bispora]QSI47466.1 FAD-binding oxidoreductase [Thermobispora bispora]